MAGGAWAGLWEWTETVREWLRLLGRAEDRAEQWGKGGTLEVVVTWVTKIEPEIPLLRGGGSGDSCQITNY